MTDAAAKVLARLRALFEVIAAEAQANPGFARRVDASLEGAQKATEIRVVSSRSVAAPVAKDACDAHPMLHNITFDPLECQIEAALLNGREQEARNFLGKLDRVQLEAVVKAQRLPGAKSLQRKNPGRRSFARRRGDCRQRR